MATNYDKYIYSSGTHYISNSGGDERGRITGGKAGDQTGKEWVLKAWYNRPWSCVLRHPDPKVRRLIAELAIEAALNNNIGYDQNQRGTFWQQLKVSGYRPANIKTKCEADCSAGANSIVKAVGYLLNITALKNVSSANSSRNTKSGLSKAGFTVLSDSKYRTSGKYLLPGDILLYVNHHVATNITRGAKAVGDVAASVNTGDTTSSATSDLRNGDVGAAVKEMQTNLISLGYSCGKDGADGEFGDNTEKAVKAFQKDHGIAQSGVYDEATRKALASALNPSATPTEPAGQPVGGDSIKITGGSVNARTGAGTGYKVFKIVHKGDTFNKAVTDGWKCIVCGDRMRWVSAKYVNASNVCTGASVNVRSGPGTAFASVAIAKKGDKFNVADTSGWVPIIVGASVCWVSEKYVA